MKTAKTNSIRSLSLCFFSVCLIGGALHAQTTISPINSSAYPYQSRDGWQFDVRPIVRQTGEPRAKALLFDRSSAATAAQNYDSELGEMLKKYLGQKAIVPSGAQTDPMPEQCRTEALELKVKQAGGQMHLIAKVLKEYFNRCENVLSRNNDHSFFSLLQVELLDYDFADLAGAQAFRLTTPQGQVIDGQLLRKDSERRPWVIIKCGVFCESESDARVKNMIMHLYDESPFNLMILNNNMTASNIIANQRINVSGFYEGHELIHAAYWLKYLSPFASEVVAVHGMGISLGGNASLFAALFNDHNLVQSQKLLNSVIAYCPVVNAHPTYLDVFRENLRGELFSNQTWGTIQAVYPYLAPVREVVNPKKKPKIREFIKILGHLGWEFLSPKTADDFLNPFRIEKPIIDDAQMWSINSFENFGAGLQTPTLVLASHDDWIVNFNINSQSLADKFNNDENSQLRVVDVAYGNHCSPSLVYGWKPLAGVLRSFYLSQTTTDSAEHQDVYPAKKLPKIKLHPLDVIADYEWLANENSDQIILNYKIWNKKQAPADCAAVEGNSQIRPPTNRDPFTSDRSCYSVRKVEVRYADLASSGIELRRAKSALDAQGLTRYLNAHLLLRNSNRPIEGGHVLPNQIVVKKYQF